MTFQPGGLLECDHEIAEEPWYAAAGRMAHLVWRAYSAVPESQLCLQLRLAGGSSGCHRRPAIVGAARPAGLRRARLLARSSIGWLRSIRVASRFGSRSSSLRV